MAKNGLAPRPVRVYADGCFDLFHSGHARVLHQAKNCFPNVYLIVGGINAPQSVFEVESNCIFSVCSDATIHKMKGRSVLNEEHRYNAVTHCRYADEVLRDAPWQYSDEFLDDNKIDFIAHDDIPYACGDVDDLYASLKQRGMFVATQRTEGISTSDIVARVVRDYDIFARRNLAKGYSAKELNLSYLKEKKFKFKNKIDKLKHTSKKMIDAIGERKDEILTRWEDTSREVVENFLLMFEPNKLRNMWHGSKEKIMKVLTPPGSPTPSTSDEVAPEPSTKRRRLH